jgi:hypothetical protein
MTSETDVRLARLEGRLEGMCEHIDARLDEIGDDARYVRGRVDRLERASAANGAISGGVVAVGLAMLGEMVRRHLI